MIAAYYIWLWLRKELVRSKRSVRDWIGNAVEDEERRRERRQGEVLGAWSSGNSSVGSATSSPTRARRLARVNAVGDAAARRVMNHRARPVVSLVVSNAPECRFSCGF
jgi:hypothetical protein